jgi:Arc/MetJ-type ribon-helix-helix transcriptional regulator
MANYERQRRKEHRKRQFLAMAGLVGTFGAGAFSGLRTRKIDLTMDAEEVRQVDLLVEQGLYPNREAFLQSAARNLLHEHGMDLPQATGRLMAAGIVMHNRKSLERLLAAGRQVEINVIGILRLADDVTPELACAVIKQLKVCGAFQASAEVKAALADRIRP